MDNKILIIIIISLLIIIPLGLLILCYRSYALNYCKNSVKCIEDKLFNNIENMVNDVKDKRKKLEYIVNNKNIEKDDNVVEGFLGNFSGWFQGSTPSKLPVAQNNINTNSMLGENNVIKSNTFPPKIELQGNNEDFKDSNNKELLNQISNKTTLKKKEIIQKNIPEKIQTKTIERLTVDKNIDKNMDIKKVLGTCKFYNDKCPDTHQELGKFSIGGVGSNTILTCGDVENSRPARAMAEIKNNSLFEIHVIDSGEGFNPKNPPKITIEGGKGHGATAEAVIDDDGKLKIIKIINPGYNYSETPNVMIDAPFMNSSCHFCCEL